MQASSASSTPPASAPDPSATPDASVDELATLMLSLWRHFARDGGSRLAAVLDEEGLGLAQLKSLENLAAGDDEPSVKEVAETAGCSLANASRVVDHLVRRGLLDRREDADDRRVKRLRVTAAGHDVVRRVNELRLDGLVRFAAGLDAAQRERLAGALRDLPGLQPAPAPLRTPTDRTPA